LSKANLIDRNKSTKERPSAYLRLSNSSVGSGHAALLCRRWDAEWRWCLAALSCAVGLDMFFHLESGAERSFLLRRGSEWRCGGVTAAVSWASGGGWKCRAAIGAERLRPARGLGAGEWR